MLKEDEQNYRFQRLRGLKRKIELVNFLGGKCYRCGYDKCLSALEFHHRNPEEKEIRLDMRHLSGLKIETLKKEASKCDLVCSNCHREIHYGYLNKENIETTLNGFEIDVSLHKEPKHKTKYICAYCGKEFKAATGKKFCSVECRNKSKNYPSFIEIKEKYDELKSWQKVADFYSINRNILRRIRRKSGEHC